MIFNNQIAHYDRSSMLFKSFKKVFDVLICVSYPLFKYKLLKLIIIVKHRTIRIYIKSTHFANLTKNVIMNLSCSLRLLKVHNVNLFSVLSA